MGQIAISTRVEKVSKLSKREQLIVLEIGVDRIDSASAFVSYLSESYGFSKSSVWYNLNRLKDKGLIDFAKKDDPGKPLSLTQQGVRELHTLERLGMRIEGVTDQVYAPLQGPSPNLSIGGIAPYVRNNVIMFTGGGLPG